MRVLLPIERDHRARKGALRVFADDETSGIVLGLFGIDGLPRKEEDREKRQVEQAQKARCFGVEFVAVFLPRKRRGGSPAS
jgi:hypothetical protein